MTLQLTAGQMQQLQQECAQRFERRLLAHLAQMHPQQVGRAPRALAQQLVGHLVARAQLWGMASEADVAGYAELALRLHPRFDEQPEFAWAREILADEFLVDPQLRLQQLHQAADSRRAAP